MNVKMKNREMVKTVNNIFAMQTREENNGEKLFGSNIKVVYAIKKNKDRMISALKPYEEARAELLKECNEPEAEKRGDVKIRKDCEEKWNKDIDTLLEIEAEVDIHMIPFKEIGNAALSLNDFEAIEFMLLPAEDAQS